MYALQGLQVLEGLHVLQGLHALQGLHVLEHTQTLQHVHSPSNTCSPCNRCSAKYTRIDALISKLLQNGVNCTQLVTYVHMALHWASVASTWEQRSNCRCISRT